MGTRVLWLALGMGIGAPVGAQIGAAALAGDVVDQAGAAVPGATVTVIAVGTNLSRTVVTGPDGGYVRPRARARRLSGARRVERIPAADPRRHPARHRRDRPAGSAAGARRTHRSGHGHGRRAAAPQRDLGARPRHRQPEGSSTCRSTAAASSRSPSLAPGVAVPPPPAAPLPRINGGRPRTNEYLFDGISVLQPEPGQVAFFPNVDAIQEFKIESNSPPAEFGRFNGGVVNLTTKSGSNAFRGSVFEFFRHEALNARNFFASTNAGQAAVSPQSVRRRHRRARFDAIGRSSSSTIRASGRRSDAR